MVGNINLILDGTARNYVIERGLVILDISFLIIIDVIVGQIERDESLNGKRVRHEKTVVAILAVA